MGRNQGNALLGKRFGRLVVAGGPEKRPGRRNYFWACKCDCGNDAVVIGSSLTNGRTKSCGCLQREKAVIAGRSRKGAVIRHGRSRTREYQVWHQMIRRCHDPKSPVYRHYGGRGITVCERWHDAANFLADMGPRPSPQHTLGRINNDAGYCPENCRWETRTQQARNTRTNILITHNGEARCLSEWATLAGIKTATLYSRIRSGMSLADAMAKPVGPYRRKPS